MQSLMSYCCGAMEGKNIRGKAKGTGLERDLLNVIVFMPR